MQRFISNLLRVLDAWIATRLKKCYLQMFKHAKARNQYKKKKNTTYNSKIKTKVSTSMNVDMLILCKCALKQKLLHNAHIIPKKIQLKHGQRVNHTETVKWLS